MHKTQLTQVTYLYQEGRDHMYTVVDRLKQVTMRQFEAKRKYGLKNNADLVHSEYS